jgi:hypothetical protein
MSEIRIKDTKQVKNAVVYDLEESIRASKFPMCTDVDCLNSAITKTVKTLGSCAKGEGHDQFLTGVIVNFDLTLSNKAWVEAERYRFLFFVSSQSTMHRIAKFDIKAQCNEYVTANTIVEVERLVKAYKDDPSPENYLTLLYNIPAGFQITARMTTNYRELKTIYSQRKNHRLPEWRTFCKWIEDLPHFKEICLDNQE